ncbi:MAG: hypoxanthine phosphoribosyltransferase [Oscillospiraceae bacterium]|nr:hypoxanthine phosphoribosyltransferase [Oscillospiraceae bacterium]
MEEDLKDVLYTEEQIKQRVIELGAQINKDYEGKAPLMIGILKGCFVFFADLARSIKLQCEIRFLIASSYGFSSVTSGTVKIGTELDFEIEGRDVIIVEDILDSGVTLSILREHIASHNPASLKVCALLDKPARRQVPISAEYLGFTCPDEFLVGYGLDYAERYRNLPYIASLKPEVYS